MPPFGRGRARRKRASGPATGPLRGRSIGNMLISRSSRPPDETVERHRAYIAAASGDGRANASRRLDSTLDVSYHSTKRSQTTKHQSSTRPPPTPAYENTAPPRDESAGQSPPMTLDCKPINETHFANPIDEICFAMQLTKPAPGT